MFYHGFNFFEHNNNIKIPNFLRTSFSYWFSPEFLLTKFTVPVSRHGGGDFEIGQIFWGTCRVFCFFLLFFFLEWLSRKKNETQQVLGVSSGQTKLVNIMGVLKKVVLFFYFCMFL